MHEDPYADPVTGVLRNKLGLGTAAALEAEPAFISAIRSSLAGGRR